MSSSFFNKIIKTHINQTLLYFLFKEQMNFQFSQSVTANTFYNQTYHESFIQPSTHTPISMKTPQTQPFNIQHIEPITFNQQQQQIQDRITLNKLRRIDLKYKQQQQKQNWLLKHKNKMKHIQQNMQNKNKKANKMRQYNIITSMQAKAEKDKRQKQMSMDTINKYQSSQDKLQECRTRANLKKNQYIFRIQNKTSEKFQAVNKRREMALKQEIQQSKKVHLQQWNNYRNGLLKKYKGKQLRDPAHLYEQFKAKKNRLKTMLQDICRSQQCKIVQTPKQSQKSLTKTVMPKFKPNKLSYFGINSQNNIQRSKKELQKMRHFLEQQNYDQNEEDYLLKKFKNFMIDEIL